MLGSRKLGFIYAERLDACLNILFDILFLDPWLMLSKKCVFFSLLLAHIKIKISMRNSHQNRCTLCKDLLTTKIWNVEWNGAWFMKYWAAFIRPFSTENWAAWLRQFLPHFLSLTRKFLTLYITSSFLGKYLLQKNVTYKKVEMFYIETGNLV